MEKKDYIKPELTVVTFRTERGYTLSGEPQGTPRTGFLELMLMENESYHETESFSTHDTWTQNDGNAFWN